MKALKTAKVVAKKRKDGASSSASAKEAFERTKKGAKVELENAKSNAPLSKCLDKKRIVFIGPSTSRADYLTLAYFAEYGRWPTEDVLQYGPAPGVWGPTFLNEAMISSTNL